MALVFGTAGLPHILMRFFTVPTAKAARVLERDTGMMADTVAKLLHERQRSDEYRRTPNA